MANYTAREQVVEIVNRLFYYTDYQQWQELIDQVFDQEVLLDMTSLGAPKAEKLTSQQICDQWKDGFKNLDAIHHQSGNYIIDIQNKEAHVKAYAVAIHYKKSAAKGTTREFTGSYNFKLIQLEKGWRITSFKFNLKYMARNLDLS